MCSCCRCSASFFLFADGMRCFCGTWRATFLCLFLGDFRISPLKRRTDWPWRPQEASKRTSESSYTFGIRYKRQSLMTFQKTKLRELSSYTLVFLHRCSTFLFLEFNGDIANHSRTLTTATFLSNKQTNRYVNDTY